MEESFVLLKPDALNSIKIKKKIFDLLKNQLDIKKKKKIYLSEKDVDIIWPYCKYDPVCHWIIEQYVCKKELLLLRVKGKDALNIVVNIKKEIRKKYATSPVQNCIHAPSNQLEYYKDINCILCEKKQLDYFYDSIVVGNFSRIKNFSIDELRDCAEKIIERFSITSFAKYQYEKCKGKEPILYILNDDIHDARYVASAILEIFPKATLLEAYWIAMGVDYEGKYPLMNLIDYFNLEEINRIEILFSKVGIRVERNKSEK